MTGFRFDAVSHTYTDLATGRPLPHITGMLQAAGYIDNTWFRPHHAERGHVVHRLTSEFDLGAIEDVDRVLNVHKGYLIGYAAAMAILRPEILKIEEASVHPRYRFGGRPDRIVKIGGRRGTLEIKSGGEMAHHAIQTALQAMLDEDESGIPARFAWRGSVYLKPNGRYRVVEHRDASDVAKAEEIARKLGGAA
jgi:hypothetical protein